MIKEHVRDQIERKIEHRIQSIRIKIVFRNPGYITDQNIPPRVPKWRLERKCIEILFVVWCVFAQEIDGMGPEWSG